MRRCESKIMRPIFGPIAIVFVTDLQQAISSSVIAVLIVLECNVNSAKRQQYRQLTYNVNTLHWAVD